MGCAESATSAGKEPGPSGAAAERRSACGEHGLYALPGSTPSEIQDDAQGRAALSAFRVAEENYGTGDPSGASKMFLQAAQALARVHGDEEVADFARYAREVSYHNALWAAAAAGELSQMRAQIEKSAAEDTALADAIKSMLVDAPVECSKRQ